MARILGIDYGARRVGISISDDAQQYAFAKVVYDNDNTLMDKIAELAAQESVERFVVGESDNPAGGQNTIMRRISIFSRALAVRTDLPVEQVSEVYTSAEARRALEQKAKTRSTKDVPVDAAAAALILQTYIDQHGAHASHNK